MCEFEWIFFSALNISATCDQFRGLLSKGSTPKVFSIEEPREHDFRVLDSYGKRLAVFVFPICYNRM